ncbi:hypothetical protein [Nocardia sp. NPDC052316]|uniref:hypothetical protein n=1 Tax=Nocardia sp. NPDC052316 TaxID=3364329 RepID=UPI0037CC8A10
MFTVIAPPHVEHGYVSSIVVSRVDTDVHLSVHVTSPRSTVVAHFYRAGTFLRTQQL